MPQHCRWTENQTASERSHLEPHLCPLPSFPLNDVCIVNTCFLPSFQQVKARMDPKTHAYTTIALRELTKPYFTSNGLYDGKSVIARLQCDVIKRAYRTGEGTTPTYKHSDALIRPLTPLFR
jgi:hypothetical protein